LPGLSQISPDLPKKPPPKPKIKELDQLQETQTEMKRKNSRRERNVKTPDPQHYSSSLESSRPLTPRAHPNERPMTPRQARAPSPEERPLVVPLPPPRVDPIAAPPPRPPPRSESPAAPPLPPRPRFDHEDLSAQNIVIPLPPSVLVREFPEPPDLTIEERQSSKLLCDPVIPPLKESNPELPAKENVSVISQSGFQLEPPPPLPEKKKARTPQLADQNNDTPKKVNDSSAVAQLLPEDEIKEHPPIKATLFAIQTAKIESIQVPSQNLTDFSEDMPLSVPQLVGKVTVESHHEPREVVVTQALTSFNALAQNIEPKTLEARAQEENHKDDQEQPCLEAKVEKLSCGLSLKIPPTSLSEQIQTELPDEVLATHQTPHLESSPTRDDSLSNRSLINSIPKPFKTEATTDSNSSSEHIITKGQQHSESARSCSSLSSSESNQSLSRKPSFQTQQSYNDDLSPLSPSSTSLTRPEKRDSKVIKAAQYWNNYIGEVLVKNKPPENPKSLEKPKKIVSAGVGQKGYNDLKNTFEQGGNLQRRNSKKMTLDSCLPGLRVTDAKSAFERKNQPPTPVIYRKNNVTEGVKEKPKWVRPTKSENEPEFPFLNKPSSDLKSRVKAKISSDNENETENKSFAVNGIQKPTFEPNEKLSNGITCSEGQKQSGIDSVQKEHPRKSPEKKTEQTISKQVQTSSLSTEEPSKISNPNLTPGNEETKSFSQQLTSEKSLLAKIPADPKPAPLALDISKDSARVRPSEENKKMTTPILIKEPHTFVAKPVQKEETVKKLKSGVVVIVNNKIRSHPVVVTANKPVVSVLAESDSPPPMGPLVQTIMESTPPKAATPESISETAANSSKLEASPTILIEKDIPIEILPTPSRKPLVHVDETAIIANVVKLPISELTPTPTEPLNSIEAAKQSLRKVPLASTTFHGSRGSPPDEERMADAHQAPMSPTHLNSQQTQPVPQNPTNGERLIPIKIEQDIQRTEPLRPREHYIPIVVEGKGPILRSMDSSASATPSDLFDGERLDYFSSDSLSRRRWGSRKKRLSSNYSDSASVSTADEEGKESAFPGLQKYTSIGKHGMEEAPLFRLRKTRPPFALQREESCSSGEEDIFNDDGFREMTAENLFSTLLTRVKSLTRRINDEHDDPLLSSALRWQQNKRIINHPLNPGGTHARLERSALRNSLKRTGPPSSGASTAPSLSRQSSTDASRLPSYTRSEDGRPGTEDLGPHYRGRAPEAGRGTWALAAGGSGDIEKALPDTYSDAQISVTSKQRLRPGYLPPPHFNSSPTFLSNNDSFQTNSFHNRTSTNHGKGIDTSVAAGRDGGGEGSEVSRDAAEFGQRVTCQSESILPPQSSSYGGLEPHRQQTPNFRDPSDPMPLTSLKQANTLRDSSIYDPVRGALGPKQAASCEEPPSLPSSAPPLAEGQFLSRALTLKKPSDISSFPLPSPQISSDLAPSTQGSVRGDPSPQPLSPLPTLLPTAASGLPWARLPAAPSGLLPPEVSLKSRRTILPYCGAKSDGLLNKHAFISCHIIAAAERKKRESYSRSSTAELPLEKVT